MRRAVLLYNPQSGLRRAHRKSIVERAAAILRANDAEIQLEATNSALSGGQQAKQFVDAGFDTIIACGGDGTVHDVLQGVVGTQADLGVIPLGTANSLAQDLGLSNNVERAASQLLEAGSHRIAVGQIEFQRDPTKRDRRYFTVAAGIGMDAALFYRINASFKRRWGMLAYCAQALRMWAFEKFLPFRVEWFDADLNQKRSEVVTQVLVVRIANFGGVLNRMAPGADLLRDDFRLILFKTASKSRYLRFAAGRMLNRDWPDPNIEFVHATNLWCLPDRGESERAPLMHAEADGELLGRVPVSISAVPNALNLLMPHTASSFQHRLTFTELPRR